MMDFKEFTTRAEQDIRAALEDASPGVGVRMNQVEKLQEETRQEEELRRQQNQEKSH